MSLGFPTGAELLIELVCVLWPLLLLLCGLALPALMWIAEWDAKWRKKSRAAEAKRELERCKADRAIQEWLEIDKQPEPDSKEESSTEISVACRTDSSLTKRRKTSV